MKHCQAHRVYKTLNNDWVKDNNYSKGHYSYRGKNIPINLSLIKVSYTRDNYTDHIWFNIKQQITKELSILFVIESRPSPRCFQGAVTVGNLTFSTFAAKTGTVVCTALCAVIRAATIPVQSLFSF